MLKLDMDSSGNFNLGGSNVDVVPVGEPIVAWCGVGHRPVAEEMTDLFGRFSQRACRGVNADFFVLGRSFFIGRSVEQFGVQFYRAGRQGKMSNIVLDEDSLYRLNFDASDKFLLANEAVDVRPIGTPVVAYHSVGLRRNPALYPVELVDFAREFGAGLGDKPNAFTFGNLIDPDGINYIAAQFYRI